MTFWIGLRSSLSVRCPKAKRATSSRTCGRAPSVGRFYAELRPVADLVGFASEARDTDELSAARMKARVMAAVRADVGVPRNGATPALRGKARSYAPWLAAAAAAIVAVVIGADDLTFRAQAERTSAEQRSQVAVLDMDKTAGDARLNALLAPGNKHFAIPQGEVVTRDGHLFIAMKLAAAPAGKIYQAWTLAKGAKAVAPSVTFVPAANGIAFVELPVNASGLAAVAVSVEPAGGSKAPTSTPKFIRKLS